MLNFNTLKELPFSANEHIFMILRSYISLEMYLKYIELNQLEDPHGE